MVPNRSPDWIFEQSELEYSLQGNAIQICLDFVLTLDVYRVTLFDTHNTEINITQKW